LTKRSREGCTETVWEGVSAIVGGRDRAWLVIFWETGRERKMLPEGLTMLYSEASYCEVYTVTDTYNSEVPMFPYQGDGLDLLLLEGPAMI